MTAPLPMFREAFLHGLSPAARESFTRLPAAALDELLVQSLDSARAAWPTLHLEESAFMTYLAARVPGGEDALRSLQGLVCGDLFVAAACAKGSEAAMAALESCYFREIDQSLSRLGANPSTIDDVKQQVRQHLFTGDRPAITSYSGTGQLRRWIRVIAVRFFHRLRGQNQKALATENHLVEALPDSAADPELAHLKQHYRDAFRAAFAEAIAALSTEDRVLLRQHFLDGLNIDAIAALHHNHRATAARWLAQARERVATQTRKLLLQKIKGQRADFDSILRLVQSQLDLSIRRHLLDAAEEASSQAKTPAQPVQKNRT